MSAEPSTQPLRGGASDSAPAPALRGGENLESHRPKFVGNAMAALLRTADVKVQRGDETRVLSRQNELLAELERKNPGMVSERPPPNSQQPYTVPSSHPPRPRVDTTLWIVLAAGLFAIAGWMLAYSF